MDDLKINRDYIYKILSQSFGLIQEYILDDSPNDNNAGPRAGRGGKVIGIGTGGKKKPNKPHQPDGKDSDLDPQPGAADNAPEERGSDRDNDVPNPPLEPAEEDKPTEKPSKKPAAVKPKKKPKPKPKPETEPPPGPETDAPDGDTQPAENEKFEVKDFQLLGKEAFVKLPEDMRGFQIEYVSKDKKLKITMEQETDDENIENMFNDKAYETKIIVKRYKNGKLVSKDTKTLQKKPGPEFYFGKDDCVAILEDMGKARATADNIGFKE